MACAEPRGEATHWTGRTMAQQAGISLSSVQRIWAEYDLQPHRLRIFKRSNDPAFPAKLREIVGLYVEPLAHSLVLSVRRKEPDPGPRPHPARSAVEAGQGRHPGRTITSAMAPPPLFAALNVLDGRVIGRCMARHGHQEFVRFLNAIESEVPGGKVIHLILDHYAAHKTPQGARPARPPPCAGPSTSRRPPAPG
jgi:hypothetical protein